MRQSWAALALALAFTACGSPGAQPDARPPQQCTDPPPAGSVCPTTCGNGVVETCYLRGGESCGWTSVAEVCDGNSTSCAALGYLGDGTATCTDSCQWETSACLGCEVTSAVLECDPVPSAGMLAVSGSELALVAGSVTRYGHDASGALVSLGSSGTGLGSIVAMPNGWIVVGPDGTLATLDASGVLGAFSSGNNEPAATYAFAATTDRMIEAWEAPAGNTRALTYRIADATAAIAVPTIRLGTEHDQTVLNATSDGSTFFVLGLGQIARISADGHVLSTSPVPAPNLISTPVLFAWGTTGGWFAGRLITGSSFAQRFDATGALVGSPMTLVDPAEGFGVDGDDLLEVVATGTPTRLRIDRITPAGTLTQSPDVGVSTAAESPQIVRFGAELVGEWREAGTAAYLARIAF